MKLREDIVEFTKDDEKIIKSFDVKSKLSDDIFDENMKMNDDVREKLLKISDNFIEYVGIEFFIHDITLTGSLANYMWSNYSDVDLHILVDFENSDYTNEILKEFFSAKKTSWNNTHNVKIKNFDVEVYVQDVNEPHESSGVYSILKNKWIVKPEMKKPNIEDKKILDKADDIRLQYENLLNSSKQKDVSDGVDKLLKKLSKFRKSGLSKNGEFSYENLTFKLLRRNGIIKNLIDLKNQSIDKKLSLKQ
jgi:DNA-binding Lrp family transcriptional regulator